MNSFDLGDVSTKKLPPPKFSKPKLKLNTGFMLEDANSTIEELFLSKNVWIRFENKTLPVIPTSKDFTFKTSLNDKLINHTIDFEFAFNKINNVR